MTKKTAMPVLERERPEGPAVKDRKSERIVVENRRSEQAQVRPARQTPQDTGNYRVVLACRYTAPRGPGKN